jgi:hypothetical protein
MVAFAKVHKHKITFENDTKVNSTVVKKGTYDLKFDDATGQLSIVKNGKVVAEAMAKLEPRTKKAGDFQLRSAGSGDNTELIGFTFGGSDKDVVLTNSGSATTGTN